MRELWDELGMDSKTKNISKDRRKALFKIIEKHMQVFTNEEVKVGKTDWMEMEIRVQPDARPVCAKVRLLSKVQKDNLKAQLDSWLKDGVIIPFGAGCEKGRGNAMGGGLQGSKCGHNLRLIPGP